MAAEHHTGDSLDDRVYRFEVGIDYVKEELADLKRLFKGFMEARDSERFSRKEMFGAALSGVAAVSIVMGGVFWLIGTQVEPVKTSVGVYQRDSTERFTGLGTSIREIRQQQIDSVVLINKMIDEQNKRLQAIELALARITK